MASTAPVALIRNGRFCAIVMEGDRGIAEGFSARLHSKETIARGSSRRKIRSRKTDI